MSGSATKEQRRHLRREIGETAEAAMNECRQVVYQVNTQQKVLAREVLEFQAEVRDAITKLGIRVDGASEWSAVNETRITEVESLVGSHAAMQQTFALMGFRARLRWALFGTLPEVARK